MHGVFVGEWLFVFPLCGISLSLFCNYHEWTDDQAGRRRLANTDSDGGSLVHAADDTPTKNAATSNTLCNFMRQGGGRPRAAVG